MTVVASHIKTKADEAAEANGYAFDSTRAEKAIAWIETTFNILLYAWQREILWLYFGWRKRDGSYRYNRISIWIPKKNGKSWLVSAIIAYKMFELKQARIYSVATTAKQAGIIVDGVINLFAKCPKIKAMMKPRGRIRTFNTIQRREIRNMVNGSQYFALANNVSGNDGIIPDVVVLDELHRMDNRLIKVIDDSTSNMPNALKVYISTAGDGDKTHLSYAKYDYAKKVLSGEIADDFGILPVIYEAADDLEEKDIYTLETLLSCNPVLVDDVEKRNEAEKELRQAKAEKRKAEWLRLRLNKWLATDGEPLIAEAIYVATEIDSKETAEIEANLSLAECFVGLDKGGVTDFSAVTLLFKLLDGRVYEKHFTFALADRVEAMNERDDMEYGEYVDKELTLIPADVIADKWLTEYIVGLIKPYNVKAVAADPYHAQYILESLATHGYEVLQINQGNNRMLSPVIEDYQERMRLGRMIHSVNTLYAWQLTKARKYITAKDTAKVVKAGSNRSGQGGIGHIDNCDSLINALAVLRASDIAEAAMGSGGVVVA